MSFDQRDQHVEKQINISFSGQGTAVSRPSAQLPRDIGDFTGRKDELTEIEQLLGASGHGTALAISAVAGMGGVGKSALVIHAAHRLKEQFTGGQLYVDLQGIVQTLEPAQVLDRFLRALGVEGNKIPLELEARVGLYRSLLAQKQVLVVLDNARDKQQVELLLPGCANCGVLITSRQKLVSLAGAHFLDLLVMTAEDGLELLRKLVGKRVATELEAEREIVKLCGRLPLAIRIAGGTLSKRPQWSLQKFGGLLQDEYTRLEKLKLDDLDVRASFNLSYRELAESEKRLFRLLGSLVGVDFGLVVAQVVDQRELEEVEESLLMLQDAQLLEVSQGERYRFHDLVRFFAEEQLQKIEGKEEKARAQNTVMQLYLQVSQEFDHILKPSKRDEFIKELTKTILQKVKLTERNDLQIPDAEEILSFALGWFESEKDNIVANMIWALENEKWRQVYEFAWSTGYFFTIKSAWLDLESISNIAKQASLNSGDDVGYVMFSINVATAALEKGDLDRGISILEENANISETSTLGIIYNNLGEAYQRRGELDQSIIHFKKALMLKQELEDEIEEAQTRIGLANAYRMKSLLKEAISELAVAHEIASRNKDYFALGLVLLNIGAIHAEAGNTEIAEQALHESLIINKAIGNEENVGLNLMNLGLLQIEKGNSELANQLWQEALTKFHPDSPNYQEAQRLLRDVA